MASTLNILEKCCVHVWERVDGDVRVYTAITAKIKALGAKIAPRISKGITHVIFGRKLHANPEERKLEDTDLRQIYSKLRQVEPSSYVVSPLWLHYSEDAGVKAKEAKYLEKEPPAPMFLESSPSKQGAKRKRKSIAARPRELVDSIDVDDVIFSSSQQIQQLNGNARASGVQLGDREGVAGAPPPDEGKPQPAKASALALLEAEGASKRPAHDAGGRLAATFPAPAPRAQQRPMRQLPLTFAVISRKPQPQAEGNEQVPGLPPGQPTELQPVPKEAPTAAGPVPVDKAKTVRFGDAAEAGASMSGQAFIAQVESVSAGPRRKASSAERPQPAALDGQSAGQVGQAPEHCKAQQGQHEKQGEKRQPEQQLAKQTPNGPAASPAIAVKASVVGTAAVGAAVSAADGPASAAQRRRRNSVVDLTRDTVEKQARPPQARPSPLPLPEPAPGPADRAQVGGPEPRARQQVAAALPRYPALPCTAVRASGAAGVTARVQTDNGRAMAGSAGEARASADRADGEPTAVPVQPPAASKPALSRLASAFFPPKPPAQDKPAAVGNGRLAGADAPAAPEDAGPGPVGGSTTASGSIAASASAAVVVPAMAAGLGTTGKPPSSARRSSRRCSGTPLGSTLSKHVALLTPNGTPQGFTPAPIVMPRLKLAGSASVTPKGGMSAQQPPGPASEAAAAAAAGAPNDVAPLATAATAAPASIRRSARMHGQLPPTPPPPGPGTAAAQPSLRLDGRAGPGGATTQQVGQELLGPGVAVQARGDSTTPRLRGAPPGAGVAVAKEACQRAPDSGPERAPPSQVVAREARAATAAGPTKQTPSRLQAAAGAGGGRGSARKARPLAPLPLSPVARPKLRSSGAAPSPQAETPALPATIAEQPDAAAGLMAACPTASPGKVPGSTLRRSARLTGSSPRVLAPDKPMALNIAPVGFQAGGGREEGPSGARPPDAAEWQGFKPPLHPTSSGPHLGAQSSLPQQKKQRTQGATGGALEAAGECEGAFSAQQEQQDKGAADQTLATALKGRGGRHAAGVPQDGQQQPETGLQGAADGAMSILPSPAPRTRSQVRAATTPALATAAAATANARQAADLDAAAEQHRMVDDEQSLPLPGEAPRRDAGWHAGQGAGGSWGGFRPPLPPKPVTAPQPQQQSPSRAAKRRCVQGVESHGDEAVAEHREGALGQTPGTARKGRRGQAPNEAPGLSWAEQVPVLPSPALHTRARNRAAAAATPGQAAQEQTRASLQSDPQDQEPKAGLCAAADLHASVRPAPHEATPGPAVKGQAPTCVADTPPASTKYFTRSQRKANRADVNKLALEQPGAADCSAAQAPSIPVVAREAVYGGSGGDSGPAEGAAAGGRTAEEQVRRLWGCVLPRREEAAGDAVQRQPGHSSAKTSATATVDDAAAAPSPRQRPGSVTRPRRRALNTELVAAAQAPDSVAGTSGQHPTPRKRACAAAGAYSAGAEAAGTKPSAAVHCAGSGAPQARVAWPASGRGMGLRSAGKVSAADADADVPGTTAVRALPTAMDTVAEQQLGAAAPGSAAGGSSPPARPRVFNRGTRTSTKKLAAATGSVGAVTVVRRGRRASASSAGKQPPFREPGPAAAAREEGGEKAQSGVAAATPALVPPRDSEPHVGARPVAVTAAGESAAQAPGTAAAAGPQETGKPPAAARPGGGVMQCSRLRTKKALTNSVPPASTSATAQPPYQQPYKRPACVLEEAKSDVAAVAALHQTGPSAAVPGAAFGGMATLDEEPVPASLKRQRTRSCAGGAVAATSDAVVGASGPGAAPAPAPRSRADGAPAAADEEAEATAAAAKPAVDGATGSGAAKASTAAKEQQPAAAAARAVKATKGPRLGPSSGTAEPPGAKQFGSLKLLSTSSIAEVRSISSSAVLSRGSTGMEPQQRATAAAATAAAAPALGQYPRGKEHPNRAGVRYLAHTSVNNAMEAAIQTATRQLGSARVYTPGYEGSLITHLVLGDPERRTMKVLLGIAYGAIFVTPAWVTNSMAAGQWLPEEQYVPPKCTFAATAGAVRLQLQEQQQRAAASGSGPAAATLGAATTAPAALCTGAVVAKPLAGHQVAVHNSQCNGLRLADMQKRKADVEKLVVALGGRVVPIRSATLLVVVGANNGPPSERRSRAGSACGPGVPTASDDWLMRLAETHVWQEPTPAT